LIPIITKSQINESDTLKTKLGLSVTGIYQGGNVETFIFRTQGDFSVKPSQNLVYKNRSSYIYQAFGRQKADEDVLTLNFLYLNPDKLVYPFVLGIASTNFRRKIDIRSLLGLGVTVEVLKKKKEWLKFSLSSEYEHTRFAQQTFNKAKYNGQSTQSVIRSTFWLNGRHYLLKEKLIFLHETYIQPAIQDFGNYRWQSDLGLEFPIWKFIHFRVNYRHSFESIVISGQLEEDRFLTFGISAKNF
jgi:hypothetical protein